MKQGTTSPSSLFHALDKFDADEKQSEKRRKLNEISSLSKSKAVKSQTNIYAGLVEIRILLQRIISSHDDANEDTEENSNTLNELLSKLLQARSKIPPIITNDVDYTQLDVNDDDTKINQLLQKEHESLSNEWKPILNSRYHALRVNQGLASNKRNFQAVDISFWDQIQQTLQHENLLNENTSNTISIDDSKIYKHMLQEYLSGGTTSSSVIKSKKRKGSKVDRKASKGRKIRYVTHTKLENFAFPVNRPEPIISEEEWFHSLFGGKK